MHRLMGAKKEARGTWAKGMNKVYEEEGED
jgi:hypothetical protein